MFFVTFGDFRVISKGQITNSGYKVGEILSGGPGISPMSSMMGMQWSVPMWCVAQAARAKVILCCKVVVGETLPEWPIISWNFLGFQ